MKIWRKALCITVSALVALFGSAVCAHAKDVTVTLPTFPVEINGIVQDQTKIEYPFIVYQDITYVPMTYYDARLLGLSTAWNDATGLAILPLNFIPDSETAQQNYVPYTSTATNKSTYTAAIAAFDITVNNKTIDNNSEEYPLLIFRNVTYFPLTWRFAVDEFGWKYSFSAEAGLKITPQPTVVFQNYTGTINGSVVNVRSGTNTDTPVVAQVKNGTNVTVIGESVNAAGEVWYKVLLEDNRVGYVASWLLVRSENYMPDDNSASSSIVTGETNQIGVSDVNFGENTSSVSYHIGSNTVSAVQPDAQTVIFTVNNNILTEGINTISQAIHGPILDLAVTQSGRNSQITIQMAPGAYCESYVENQVLTITVKYRDHSATDLSGKLIVIDPGHGDLTGYGSSDPGAIGSVLGYTDREVGTHVGNKLKSLLEGAGATVILTRTADPIKLSLTDRAEISNRLGADMFISLHGNAVASKSKKGAEVYYYAGSAQLNPQCQSYVRKELAQYISDGIAALTQRSSVVKTSNFAVIREAHAPAILIECGYLSNVEDELLLANENYQMTIAVGIYQGISQYFSAY